MQTTCVEKQVTMDIIIEDLEDLGDYLTVKQMAQNIKIYDEVDILALIEEGELPAIKIKGELKVRLEKFAEHYAEIIDFIPKNGEDPDFPGEFAA
ncbi:helix-turn-helix domain-containing protein [Halanaerobium congolense]|jgi:hypothetical protein|uniref:helix-turn-helix domain-containing protein n=1 Tax=Halanaerobium congolense TaxID=54121 RepID=UPI001061DD48|nr:helix-turn-helix domain-containing protein [Halanaerobium congolense]TDP26813.1 hypothetical protein C8C79_10210 [Halanaerobium congolense]